MKLTKLFAVVMVAGCEMAETAPPVQSPQPQPVHDAAPVAEGSGAGSGSAAPAPAPAAARPRLLPSGRPASGNVARRTPSGQ